MNGGACVSSEVSWKGATWQMEMGPNGWKGHVGSSVCRKVGTRDWCEGIYE